MFKFEIKRLDHSIEGCVNFHIDFISILNNILDKSILIFINFD